MMNRMSLFYSSDLMMELPIRGYLSLPFLFLTSDYQRYPIAALKAKSSLA